jgi:trigger factor
LVDIRAEVDDEELVNEEAYEMVLDADSDEFEQGFAEQIVGMTVGEQKEFSLTLGQDWGEKAGEEATFAVDLQELRNRIVPDLDDDLARTVGDFDTLEELRESIREQFEADAQREADQAYVEEVIEALVDGAELAYPPEMVEDQVDDMLEDLERRLEAQRIVMDDYFKLTGQTEEQFRETLRPQAETTVERGLVLGAVARAESLEVEGQEVDDRIAALSSGWGDSAADARDALSSPENVRSIATSLLTDKVVERLVAIAKGEAPHLEELEAEDSEEKSTETEEVVAAAGEEMAATTEEETPDEQPEGSDNEETSLSESA